jgi:hypothetical protein
MAADKGEEFKPGQVCKQSGIYQVVHDPNHKEEHEVTVVNGKGFPPCRDCGGGVRFTLVHPARHLDSHEAFDHHG